MANFDEKVFMFPEPWIELRKELEQHWNPAKTGMHPHHHLADVRWNHWQCGWAMAFDASEFIEYMNTKLDGVYKIMMATNDTERAIGYVAGVFLKELRKRRGEPNP